MTYSPSPPILENGLSPRLVPVELSPEILEWASTLPSVALDPREIADIECLGVGAFTPLRGFMTRDDHLCVVDEMRLSSGSIWPLPITLSVDRTELRTNPDSIALTAPAGRIVAVLYVEDVFSFDPETEARLVFGTTDPGHPGVAALLTRRDLLVGGTVDVIEVPNSGRRRLRPLETRRHFAEQGWKTIAGFQTRNPIHRAHEYLTKCALETVDGLLIHPLVGETKVDDVSVPVRIAAYEALLENYYPRDRVLLSEFPAAMRYAGPREAIFHALCRRNYGCTHFIVGRDHAGVGNFYGSFDAQLIFEKFDPLELGIVPLFFDHAFFCSRCGQMATSKTCPHASEARLTLSGTEVRRRLQSSEDLPEEFSRPEVAAILRNSLGAPDG